MRLVSADDLDRDLAPGRLRRHLEAAFAQDLVAPPRHHHEIAPAGPVQLLMPAWTAGVPGPGQYLGTKIVNVFPGNAARGDPAVLGSYLLQSGETGAPLALVDGTRLTHLRTAAVSALGSQFLSRPDSRRLLMVGAGALAPFLIAAHAAARPITQVAIWNRSRAAAETLARRLDRPGLAVVAVDDLSAAVADADIVSCATLAREPLLRGAWLRPGQHVDLVGAFTLAMREADDEVLTRGHLFADTSEALTEGGDLAAAIRSGAIGRERVEATLGDLCRGRHAGRPSRDAITVFKAVGTAAADLATAILAYEQSRASSA